LGDRDFQYDQMVGDLTQLIDKLKELASSHLLNEDQRDAFKNAFENFLKTEARGKTPEGNPKRSSKRPVQTSSGGTNRTS
jgi:hypothetical protein